MTTTADWIVLIIFCVVVVVGWVKFMIDTDDKS